MTAAVTRLSCTTLRSAWTLVLLAVFIGSFESGIAAVQGQEQGGAAAPEPVATPVERMRVADGFEVELLYSVPADQQGSWVSMTVDNRGRLITSDQYGKLYRVTTGPEGVDVQPLATDIGGAHGLLYAFDSLYVMVNGNGSGLYRLRDTTGDDQFDEVKQLISMRGGGEHGPHAIIPGPDGQSLYVCAGNHTDLFDVQNSRAPRVWKEDHILSRMWDARGHAAGKLAPGGWIVKMSPDGSETELISNGYRNEYDIAFNADGELFTYDADMEWDIGTPWYRPTRVCHVTSGSEFGWRSGTGKWPAYYPDSLPGVVDIGPGSPTGIVFGTGAKFPARYQRALFIADWSFGILYAVHLTPSGSTYVGELEHFVSASPLPLTDLVVHPVDGHLYFTIGGRRTQSGLYRVKYVGDESTEPAGVVADPGAVARAVRHQLEAFHGHQDSEAVEAAWPHLSSRDRAIRFAARIAVENQPLAQWQHRVLDEQNPWALVEGALALARHGDADLASQIIAALNRVDWNAADESLRLSLLRAYALTFSRMGHANEATASEVIAKFQSVYPDQSTLVNHELARLLSYLKAPGAIDVTLQLLENADTQESVIHYLYCLRELGGGTTEQQQRRYYQAFNQLGGTHGGASFGGFLRNIRTEAIEHLSDSQKAALGDLVKADFNPQAAEPQDETRPVVKEWKLADLEHQLDQVENDRDFERGRRMFAVAQCYKCHRLRGAGGITGPDLTSVGGRFSARHILEAVVEPSRVVSDQYQMTQFLMHDGRTVTGRIINLGGDSYQVCRDMMEPGNMIGLKRDAVEQVLPSPISPMPSGLLNTLTADEILDLLAFLRSGANPDSGYFAPASR